ncbi:Glutamine-scyllo-inositol transaminase -like protein [Thioalkalivibrio nitratireducens DSM 14787]|uniref:Glutamine-scyllo-inositol transaminase-like protein n=1 Tax=Thioalkalivibrio nitratireducens (strain DSM 14787 / UNIQEM 213 / ALEN2) TaxID=1255043 RepID=L0DX23_THIND|nr:DegT/DnrJ/EryC1/StrS family aminotransferase [Thioalkalivibrio nitratireducens]AGA33557.1 Glutamine-scyllo-inositol transaminase -like protein [Thioalkalivibrio nitratireducens DSM 14787]
MIPMVDLQRQYQALRGEIDAAIAEVLESTRFILGPNVQALESELAEYLGVPYAVTCASGTDALHLALRAADLGPGDEIITTPFTFIATAEAIRYVGAEPVFVDIDPRSFNLDPDAVAAAITPRTRAILPVHLFGQPANMPALTQLAEDHQLLLIEDCAQSFGARVDGIQTGSASAFGCFSFFPSKNLGAYGDGGLITTGYTPAAERLLKLRNHGSKVRYHHDEIGYNSRLDEIQAAILRVKLRHIDRYNAERRRVAARYAQALAGLDLEIPHEDGIGVHVYHQYTVLTDRRDAIMAALQQADIGHAIYYPIPLHRQAAFDDRTRPPPSLPVSESVAGRCLSLPVFPELEDAQIDAIGECIRAALA